MAVDLLAHLHLARRVAARRPLGLFTDFDGTLSPIASTPEAATTSPRAHRALLRLARQLDLVAFLSGRAVDDLRQRAPVPGAVYVGLHGLETWQGGKKDLAPGARQALPALREARARVGALGPLPGLTVEDKGLALALHYRLSPHPGETRRLLLQALQGLPPEVEVREGKMVVEVRPRGENKGTALRRLALERALAGAFCLGDDLTDLDAFRALGELRERGLEGLAVAVAGPETPPALLQGADATLQGVGGVEEFLEWLARETAPPRGGPARPQSAG